MNRCVYCLHENDRRARCCTPDCERHVRGKIAYNTRARRLFLDRAMAQLQKQARHRSRWRAVAMTNDPAQLIIEIFGTLPVNES